MCNVAEKELHVQSDPSENFNRAADLDTSDRAWLRGEASEWRGKASPTDYDLAGFVASTLEELALAMNFHRTDSAVRLARVRRIDLEAVYLPVPPYHSPLAEALTVEAAWYLQIESWAGSLAAHALLYHAALAEEMGSQTVEDWVIDEAAWKAAAMDAAELRFEAAASYNLAHGVCS
jgi:hypothetical protein